MRVAVSFFFWGRAVLQPFRKFSSVLGQAGADEVVRVGEAEGAHLVHGFLGGPALFRHSVSRDYHSGAVVSQAAMHNNLLAFVLVHDAQAIIVHDTGCPPDDTGSYINGTWTQAASLPSGYEPLFFGSAVLADGKVVVQGGEYNCPTSTKAR
jgi:hypothetical protein